jgi:hypothetical protein
MKPLTFFLVAAIAAPQLATAQARGRSLNVESDLPGPRGARLQRAATTASAVTAATVGDADSFGRTVKYLGVAQTLPIALQQDCTGSSPADERCLVLAPAPELTGFEEVELARIDLPANATQSLLCFAITPFIQFQFQNPTGVPQPNADFNVLPFITVENPVLADPALIDPATGAPFGGKFETALGTFRESRSLAVDERAFQRLTLSRSCIGGLVSRSFLVEGLGLTDAQAKDFFKKPITLRFGAIGAVQLVDFANYFYGIRIYGD